MRKMNAWISDHTDRILDEYKISHGSPKTATVTRVIGGFRNVKELVDFITANSGNIEKRMEEMKNE